MIEKLKPFFCFYGGKWRAGPKYPIPCYDSIIEPFAGAAGYATRYYYKKIILNDIDPIIYGVWDFLIKSSKQEILKLPINIQHVDDAQVCQEAKSLIGFWFNKAANGPRLTPSSWMRQGTHTTSFWGENIRQRISNQVEHIKHWKIYNVDYNKIIDTKHRTWFIDPPYNNEAGRIYKFKNINYQNLSNWCLNRYGQIIVCENFGANWLDFKYLGDFKSNESYKGKSITSEVIYTNDQ